MHLVQLKSLGKGRRIAVVEDALLRLVRDYASVYDLATDCITRGLALESIIETEDELSYNEVYQGRSEWKLLPPFDHPTEPARCLVTGTGLTHKASAENRARMHQHEPAVVTDSMRMYRWGLEGGSPPAGQIGVQPEWFYKGNGSLLRAHGEPLTVPAFANDGGEEPEIAGVYLIAPDGAPYRVGLVTGNEFSDHQMERKNYLYLAPSKLRECAIGPELRTGLDFDHREGKVSIERAGATVWTAPIFTGERNMSHTVANLEHHHFKYPEHRRPGDVHIHFFGADAFSFGDGFALQANDVMVVAWQGMGRALRNPVHIEQGDPELVRVGTL